MCIFFTYWVETEQVSSEWRHVQLSAGGLDAWRGKHCSTPTVTLPNTLPNLKTNTDFWFASKVIYIKSAFVTHTHLRVQGVNVPVMWAHNHQTCEGIHSRTALHSVSCLKLPTCLSRCSTQEIDAAIVATLENIKIILMHYNVPQSIITKYSECWYWPITNRVPQWDTAAEASILSPRTRSHSRLPVSRSKACTLWECEPMNTVVLVTLSGHWFVPSCTRSSGDASTHLPVSEDQLRLTPRAVGAPGWKLLFLSGFLMFISITSFVLLTTLTTFFSPCNPSAAGDSETLRSFFDRTSGRASACCLLATDSDDGMFSSGDISVTLAMWRKTAENVLSRIISKSSGELIPAVVRMSSQRRRAFNESPPLNRKLDSSSILVSSGRSRVRCQYSSKCCRWTNACRVFMWNCVIISDEIPATTTEAFFLICWHLHTETRNTVSVFGIFSLAPPCLLCLPENEH